MIPVLIGISALFVAIAFGVTENNAKYLLAGYNTMSEDERSKVDIKNYIPYLRKFHLFLGTSFLLAGLILYYVAGANAGWVFIGTYPIVGYMYFIWRSARYSTGTSVTGNKVAFFILGLTLVFVVVLLALGFRETKLTVTTDGIEITGMYGEVIAPSSVKSVALTNALPVITMKTNGFAMGAIQKGYFRTGEGETVKLILNTTTPPYLLLIKQSGEKIYFSPGDTSIGEIYAEIKKVLPDIAYEK